MVPFEASWRSTTLISQGYVITWLTYWKSSNTKRLEVTLRDGCLRYFSPRTLNAGEVGQFSRWIKNRYLLVCKGTVASWLAQTNPDRAVRPRGPFLKGPPKSFRTWNKPYDFRVCFIHVSLIWTEVLFIQEVPGVYTSLDLDTDYLKMAWRAQNVSRNFEKRAPGREHYVVFF